MKRKASKKLVALVGRPNVGKSTLFNVLTRSRNAIVEDTPGLTRDRNYGDARVDDKAFQVVDTGGFEPVTDDPVLSQMRAQTLVAVEQADIIVFMGDARAGVTPSDEEIVRMLQQTDKKVFYVVNKVDSERYEDLLVDFYSLGLEHIHAVSAMTGYGLGDFMDILLEDIPPAPETPETPSEEPAATRIAVVGRPNVGKSTLINLLLGEERLVAHPQPGTTRDSIDALVRRQGKDYLFIDTAGIRRRSRIVDRVEKYSVIKAFRSIDRAEIVLVLLDAAELVTEQDARIAGYAFERGRGVVLLINKWDLIEKDANTHIRFTESVRNSLKFLDHAPVMTISAREGKRAPKIFDLVDELRDQWSKRISTGDLNRYLDTLKEQHPPGMHRRTKRVKIYYATQVRTAPPTFAFFCNYPESIHFSYKRFLENRIREAFDFGGSPIRLAFRKRGEDGRSSGRPAGSRRTDRRKSLS